MDVNDQLEVQKHIGEQEKRIKIQRIIPENKSPQIGYKYRSEHYESELANLGVECRVLESKVKTLLEVIEIISKK